MKLKSLLILLAAALMMVASGCKKEAKPGQLESISFKQASYTIAENCLDLNLRKELQTVPETVKDTAKITFAVSDENIAYMDGVYLTPKRDGDVTVTATIQGKSATCNITITKVEIESFSLQDFSVIIGQTAKAPLTTTPEGISRSRFEWSLSDYVYAIIDQNGVVTGAKEGTVEVIATVNGKSEKCTLTVEKIPVDNITLSKSSIVFVNEGETEQLTATVTPEEATYKTITWSSSNTWIATVQNGLVKFVGGMGKAEITATVDGKTAVCNVESFKGIRDCQGNAYHTVKIGSQTWMADNLKCSKYDTQSERAGAELSTQKSSNYDPYYVDNTGVKTTYSFITPEQISKLGYLYSWAAAVGAATGEEAKSKWECFSETRQGICPDGWHLPTTGEWRALATEIGGTMDSQGNYPDIGKKLKTRSGWKTNNGTDDYSFSALPAGEGYDLGIGVETFFWTSCAYSEMSARGTTLYNTHTYNDLLVDTMHKTSTRSIRCVKN